MTPVSLVTKSVIMTAPAVLLTNSSSLPLVPVLMPALLASINQVPTVKNAYLLVLRVQPTIPVIPAFLTSSLNNAPNSAFPSVRMATIVMWVSVISVMSPALLVAVLVIIIVKHVLLAFSS